MSRKSNKVIYRIGDLIKIINPALFERVGYPWTKEYVKNTIITDSQKNFLADFLKEFKIFPFGESLFGRSINERDINSYDKILDELAYNLLHKNCFGGSERKIYTTYNKEYNNVMAEVVSKRVVKTGNYYSGWYSPEDYSGDCDPSCLRNEKTHIILKLRIVPKQSSFISIFYPIEIEENNVIMYRPANKLFSC